MAVVQDLDRSGKGPMKVDNGEDGGKDQTIETIKHALANQNLDHKQTFAVLAVDERGNLRVHASGGVRDFLNEIQLETQYHQAMQQAANEPQILGPQQRRFISEDIELDVDDDSTTETELTQLQPSIEYRNSRIFRAARYRGESMLPHKGSRFSVCPYGSPGQEFHQTSPPQSRNKMPTRSPQQTKSFRADDSAAVIAFLSDRLKRMQQLADKKIAKAWIKGICPMKQAKYPYQNNKLEKETGRSPEVPEWWPDTSEKTGCRFVEPDHIRREERMRLCVHLLRLRPTQEQLRKWNIHETKSSHIITTKGWTAFLKALAPVSILEGISKEPPEKLAARMKLMEQMYEAAEFEEDYMIGGRDGCDTFLYADEDEAPNKVIPAKRSRAASLASTAGEERSRQSSTSSTGRGDGKCARGESVLIVSAVADGHPDEKYDMDGHSQRLHILGLNSMDASSLDGHHLGSKTTNSSKGDALSESDKPKPKRIRTKPKQVRRDSAHAAPSQTAPSKVEGTEIFRRNVDAETHPLRSFDGQDWQEQNLSPLQYYTPLEVCDGYALSNLPPPGTQEYAFPPYHHHNQFEVHHVGNVPQPCFEAVPHSAMLPTPGVEVTAMNFLPSNEELHHQVAFQQHQHQQPPHHHYTSSMPIAPYYTTSGVAGSAVAHTHPPMYLAHPPPSFQQQASTQTQHHGMPMQYQQVHHGLPWTEHN